VANPHDELARLLDHARADAPSAQLLSGVRERMLSATGAPPTPIESMIAPRAISAASTGAASWLVKLSLGALLAGLIAAGYQASRPAAREAKPELAPQTFAPAVPASPSPVELAPAPAPPLDGPVTEPPVLEAPKLKPRRVIRPPQPEPVTRAAPPPAPSSSFAEEVALLKLALDAQRAGRVGEARAKLDEHARRFSQGQLVSERKRIEARLPP
jgi:hypothetical protein